MDGRVGRLRSESADSESGRPLATRLWGGNTDPPTGQSGLVKRYRMKLGIYGAYDMRCAVQRLTPGYFT
ncbi:hypothetical protein Taro_029227 [Colocasia esculenta]|uniref:Uncharacterized protein n=1 Tax=Colocasia esculenta TaxID=4460 RepID=A0A843VKR8_COLES|nr:hypothetical protein [Colocasia esculenta]